MTVNDLKINEFQNNNKILIPSDLKQYFLLINGSNDMPLDNLYEFYSINRIFNEFKDWNGVPDYNKLEFQQFENVFIFGNYEFNFYSFGIELSNTLSSINRIFIFCGSEYRIIANSFSEFIDLYLDNPEEIYV